MSHIVQIKTEVKDEQAVRAACLRLKWEQPTFGAFQVFGVNRVGLGIKLPQWSYPVVVDLATGAVDYDNYNGMWGKQETLDAFLQSYAIEKAKLEAAKNGYSVYEEPLSDGSVKLTVTLEA
jgi:hypothetical protein